LGHRVTLAAMIGEVADSLRPLADEIPDLQIYSEWNDNPSPPCLDVYPGSPFQDGAGFGPGNRIYLTVRARVAMADPSAAQQLLLRLLDTEDAASVEMAVWSVNWAVAPDGVSGYVQYADDAPANERMLGCEWRISEFQ
jgi:hypothetical protein